MTSTEWNPSSPDLTDEMWELIRPVFEPKPWGRSKMGRPRKWAYRVLVEAVFYVGISGCQWRLLPEKYPPWSTVHRYHLRWSKDGTWETACDLLVALERQQASRDVEPSAAIIDARSVKSASTVCGLSRGYDAGKKILGRKLFAVVDTLGLLLAVVVVAANVSDNVGGALAMDRAAAKSRRLTKLWADMGFKKTFIANVAANHGIETEIVSVKDLHTFKVQPRRWVVERTYSWLVNHRRLRIDYERDPQVTEGFVYAAHTLMLLRRLTTPTTP